MFLAPATVALALSVYNQIKILKEYFLPILAGCLAGAVTSMGAPICCAGSFTWEAG
jgi:putative effector of murein hydrolase